MQEERLFCIEIQITLQKQVRANFHVIVAELYAKSVLRTTWQGLFPHHCA